MMYLIKFLNKINSVKKIEVVKDFLIILSTKKALSIYGKNNNFIKEFDFAVSTFYIVNDFILSSKNEYIDLKSLQKYSIEGLEGRYYSGICNGGYALYNSMEAYYITNLNNNFEKLAKIDFRENESIIEFVHSGVLWISDSQFSFRDKDSVLKWELQFRNLINSNNAYIQEKVIVFNEKLFVVIVDSVTFTSSLFILNMNTGETIKTISDFTGSIKLINDKIYHLHDQKVFILYPETFKVEVVDFKKELFVLNENIEEFSSTRESIGKSAKTYNFSKDKFIIHNEDLYFSQERGASFGMLKIQNKSLEWISKIADVEGEDPMIVDIKVKDSYVYVLDNENRLNIFEIIVN